MSTGEITFGEVAVERRRRTWLGSLGLLARKNPLGAFGAVCVVIMAVMALTAPWISPYDPTDASFKVLGKPDELHKLGTDRAGRDVMSRVIWGSRTSLTIGILVSTIGASIATLLGLTAGYFQRWPDYLIQRTGEVLAMMPDLLIMFMFVFAFGPGFKTLVVAMSITGSFQGIRVIRGTTLSEKQNQYVEASQALGAGHLRIILRHLLPNILPLAIVMISTRIGGVILAEASLSFLGLGIPPPSPSWGADIGGQARTYFRNAPWLALAPGIALSITVLGVALFGDSLRDVLDPRLRRRA